MPETQIKVSKPKFDALLKRMIDTPPLTLEDTKKEKAAKKREKK